MKRIKVVIASNIMHYGGAERTVQTIATNLDREQFDLTVLCMQAGGSRVQQLVDAGVRVLIGDGTIEKIKELLPDPDIDILHFHRSGHTEELHKQVVEYLNPRKLMETNVFAFRDPVLGPRFDLHVYKSMMMLTQRVWSSKKPKSSDWWKRERVIYNPVTDNDFEKYRLSSEERLAKRQTLGIGPDDIVIGRNGRDDPGKWGDLILCALPQIKKDFPNLKIIFQTAPRSRTKWLERKGYLDGMVIVLPETGNERELAETYQLLDIYVHLSRRGEAFGNSLNEAMVWGLPIIVENTPHWDNGQLEQVSNDKTGYVVKSLGGLVAALKKLVDDRELRGVFGQAGRAKVVSQFGLEKGIGQYELAYRQLADLVDDKELRGSIFPSHEEIEHYSKNYELAKQLDYPHTSQPLQEFQVTIKKALWRINDSLVARGFRKI